MLQAARGPREHAMLPRGGEATNQKAASHVSSVAAREHSML